MLFTASGAQASQATDTAPFPHHASALPFAGSARAQPTPPLANYDEQIGMTFTQSFAGVSYNVTAVQQTDSDGYGPAYLLNGLTDAGYWYQIGVSYDWPYANGGYQPGFAINFEVFDNAQNSIYPTSGGGGLDNFTGPVNSGDSILLSLSFSGGSVVMSVKDWNTGTTGQESYAAFGTKFVGLSTPSDSNGYFTGPMTEWYHVNPYYATDRAVTYSNPKMVLTSADVWADEFNANTFVSLFGSDRVLTFTNPDQLQSFSTNGAVIHANAYTFITGALTQTTLTFAYSVAGGGSGYSAPTLTYVFNGTTRTATLSGSLATYNVDMGTKWSVSPSLPGGSSTERWATGQVNGIVDSALTQSIVYYHQFLASFVYRVSGGTGYTAPSIQTSSFGGSANVEGNASAWVDAGGVFAYPTVLPGSSTSERWAAQNIAGTVVGSAPVAVQYHLQYGVTLSYSIIGGGAPGTPSISGTQFGSAFSSPVTGPSTFFVDPGSSWSVTTQLPNSNSQERWVTAQTANGTASAPASLVLTYHHQYSLTTATNPAAGGTTSQSNGWADSGSTFQLSQVTNQGWKFVGWTGSGSGSYTGSSNSTNIVIGAPITETAVYYPGLNIQAGADGAVTYTYGAASGTVQGGSSQTVFPAPGSAITLEAAPSSFLYSFSGWGIGASGSDPSATITISSPTAVQANFTINVTVVGGILGVVVIAAAALAVSIRSRRRAPAQS